MVLQKVNKHNITTLFERLTIDLEYHYKDKLLSAASGSFDSKRVLGKSKKVREMGYIRPTELQRGEMLRKTIGSNIYSVPNITENIFYT